LVGYGNVAGFLFHKGIFAAPSSDGSSSNAPTTTADGTPINPITGIAERDKPSLPEMSDEEKEREMEKLFVLFDRLEKTGALPKDQNPIRKAIQSGKLG
jgi:acyl-CoA hydrolase